MMRKLCRLSERAALAALVSLLAGLSLSSSGQTTPNVTVEILGIGAESLLGGDLTDPENDGLDELGAAEDPSWNWDEITSSHEPDFEGGENSFNIFDNKVGGGNDKWCCDDPTVDVPVWVAVKFPQPVYISHFTVTSGNDSPDRDPTDWAIQGSNDGENFTDIYRFVDSTVPWTERNQVVKFTLPGFSQAYGYIRYIAYDTPGTLHQINEIEYFGGTGTPTDTDNDGMPDDYEVTMGFNPNNPADAAQDFDGDGATNLAEYQAGTNPIDTTKPTIVSVVPAPFDTVRITFSEELDPATATNTANYAISPALAITGITYDRRVVTLTTAAQTPNATAYTVTLTGIQDTSKNVLTEGNAVTFYTHTLTKTGVVKFSYWGGIEGTPIDNLLADPRYPATPDEVGALFSFNSRDYFPDDTHDNYGATIEGYITPEQSGDYRFFIYSDDASQLLLSTDASAANLTWIAEELGCCNPFAEPDGVHTRTSEPISLVAGQRYFIQLIYKEGGGGDYGMVAWRREGDTTPAASLPPIPGRFLSSEDDLASPAGGAFTAQSPAANARNVLPNAPIRIVHRDGVTAWAATNVTLKVDGVDVTPVFTKEGNVATISYQPPTLAASESSHTVVLGYLDAGGQPATHQWSYVTAEYGGPLLDKVANIPVILLGAAQQSTNTSGHTGADGDRALDAGIVTGVGMVPDASFLNASTGDDSLTIAYFQKLRSVRASSAFWANSTSSASSTRGFQAHTPWSDSTIYFDTSGCCDADITRISANIDQFPEYTGDPTWWEDWHHFAFVKDGQAKRVYINGILHVEGLGDPLKTDFTSLMLGGGPSATENRMDGYLDDFTIYSGAITEAQALSLSGGAAPSSVTGLVAHWDFNDAPAATVNLTAVRTGNQVTITSTPAALPAGWVIETASSISGPWTAQGGTTPITIDIGAGNSFLRAKGP